MDKCKGCKQEFDRPQLTQWGEYWFCSDCIWSMLENGENAAHHEWPNPQNDHPAPKTKNDDQKKYTSGEYAEFVES